MREITGTCIRALRGIPELQEPVELSWHQTVVDMVLDRMVLAPEKLAVCAWDGALTYGELDRASSRLAAQLPRSRVALWLDRGQLLPVCVLAAMRAGAVFTILDPSQPDSRNRSCVDVFEPDLIVCAAPARPLPAAIARTTPVLDVEAPETSVTAPVLDGPAPRACDAAYVLFTSGTTGVPKAILTDHAPLAHFLEWQARVFELGPDDRVSVVSGLAHDPLFRDLFAPLAAGATACIPPQAYIREPSELRRWLRDAGVTVMHLTPALGQLLGEGKVEPVDGLRVLFSGGARLRANDVERFRRLAPSATVVNVYGTSETPQVMAYHAIAADDDVGEDLPIGRAIDDVELVILDGDEPVERGAVGEIVVRTRFLSRGYLGDDALTRARYGAGAYRTGDLGVMDDDGVVHYRGRKDDQLKVNGYRIEPGEIEAALLAHPDVAQAVVVPSGGDAQLVLHAYVVARGEAVPTERELRAFAGERLPTYMMPARFVALSALPLNPNGKVDKRKLPAPPESSPCSVRARNEIERKVIEAWQSVLGHTPDLDDDFFVTGGSSLLALRMLNLLEESTGIRLPMRAMLAASTPARLAARLATPDSLKSETVVSLRAGGERPPLFVLPGGGGISVLGFKPFAELVEADRPVYGLEVPIREVTAHLSVEERAASFISEIRRVQPRGPYHLMGFSLGSWLAFEMARQLEAAGDEVKFLAVFDTHCKPVRLRSRKNEVLIRLERYRHTLGKFMRRTTADKVEYLTVLGKSKAQALKLWSEQRLWELRDRAPKAPEKSEKAEESSSEAGAALTVDAIDKGARQLLRAYGERFDPAPIRARLTIVLAENTSFAGVDPSRDPRLGWRHFTHGGIDVHTVPGSHLGMMLPPNLQVMAGVISRSLSSVDC